MCSSDLLGASGVNTQHPEELCVFCSKFARPLGTSGVVFVVVIDGALNAIRLGHRAQNVFAKECEKRRRRAKRAG